MNNEDKILSLIKKDMKGKGTVKDWIKKNKRALTIAGSTLAGILGTIGTVAVASHLSGKKKQEENLDVAVESPPLTDEDIDVAAELFGTSRRLPEKKRLTARERKSMGSGKSGGASCGCGRTHKEIMEELGGYQVANDYLVKYPKVGAGLIDDLIHKGITKGFNFVGNIGLSLLIETVVKIIGEPFRKDIEKLVKKYGWKSITLIKKYAHKGINYIKEKVDKKFGGMLCPQCNDFLDNEFRCGNIDTLEKFGYGWKEDLANGVTWFSKSVLAPAVRIIPGSVGEALAYPVENVHKLAELESNWKYQNPFEEEGSYLETFEGAQSKGPKSKGPKKKGQGFRKPDPPYYKDTFRTVMSLIPTRIIGRAIGEKMGNPHWDMLGGSVKEKLVKIGQIKDMLVEHLPVDLLKQLFEEVFDIPKLSILPKSWRKHGDTKIRSIWGDPEIRMIRGRRPELQDPPRFRVPSMSSGSSGSSGSSSGSGRSGGTKMLPKPSYTKEENEMRILPYDEPEMHILPYPYPQDLTKPYRGESIKNLINPLSDPKKFREIVKKNSGKRGGLASKRGGFSSGAKKKPLMTIKEMKTNLPLMDKAPDHREYSGSGKRPSSSNNYSNLQDPNFNTNKLMVQNVDNQDYSSYEVGMKKKAQGKVMVGGKRRKATKKQIAKKLKF